jgi:hypothetical protein
MTILVDIIKDPVIRLKARRTLDGNIIIFDHEDIDIHISEANKKFITFPKDQMSDKVYDSQDRIFKFLASKGIIEQASVRGGNVYGAMEANILESKIPGVDALQACLYIVSEYINREKPFFRTSSDFEDDRLDYLLKPSDEDSTELGDVPQEPRKGSLHPGIRPYGFMYNYSLVRESNKED